MGKWPEEILPKEDIGIANRYICCCSVAQLCPTLCNPMDCSTPGLPALQHFLEFAQIHIHWVSDAIQPPRPLLYMKGAKPLRASQVARVVKDLAATAGDAREVGLIPGSRKPLGGVNGNPLQYSCLEKSHGARSLVGYSPWGLQRVGRDWVSTNITSHQGKANQNHNEIWPHTC